MELSEPMDQEELFSLELGSTLDLDRVMELVGDDPSLEYDQTEIMQQYEMLGPVIQVKCFVLS